MFEAIPTGPNLEKDFDIEKLQRDTLDFLYSYEQPEFFIDKGGVGRVYELPNGFCIKLLESRHNSPNRKMLDLGNTPAQEAALQKRAFELNHVSKTKVPYMFGVIEANLSDASLESEALVMERLNAVNLQKVIAGEFDLPENFDLDDFLANIETFIQELNEKAQIAHKDLYARNIMVDIETGQPYVIDFGRSVDLSQIQTEEEKQKHIDHDWQRIDELCEALEALQNS